MSSMISEADLSNSELLLLTKYSRPLDADHFDALSYWRDALGYPPNKAISKLIHRGLLRNARLDEILVDMYRAVDLREMLRERSLPVSGTKAAMAARLVEGDREGMCDLFQGHTRLSRSDNGRRTSEQYKEREIRRRAFADEGVISALDQRRYRLASEIVAEFEANSVFPRGLGLDWNNYNHARDERILTFINQKVPRLLGSVRFENLAPLRLTASMNFLWGTNRDKRWIPEDLQLGISLDPLTAARMMLFHAHHLSSLENYREIEVETVKIRVVRDDRTCEECPDLVSETYDLEEVPELPYWRCTSHMGCRCMTYFTKLKWSSMELATSF